MDNLFSTNHELIPKIEKEKLLKQKEFVFGLLDYQVLVKLVLRNYVAKKLHANGFLPKF